MSDRNNRNDDLQDYLDLLDAYSKKSTNGFEILRKQEDKKIEKSNIFEGLDVPAAEEAEDADDIYTLEDEVLSPDDVSFYFEDEESGDSELQDIKPGPPAFIDLPAEKEKNPFKRISDWYNNLPKKKKIIVSVIAIILSIVITLTAVLGIFLYSKVDKMIDGNEMDDLDQVYQDPVFDEIEVDIGSAGFKQALIDWATTNNDKKMSSKNVINVLLIGADSRNGTNTGNTDVMMLLSLNRKTKKITIASFLRDSYLYVNGDNHDYCTKLNAAFSMGGPDCLIETIENNYKIEIDNYVMVNFKTFEKIIDEMGGVEVPKVEQFESDYNVKKHGIPLPVGENVTMNGAEALCFVRNRSCYGEGDLRRSENQRIVVNSIMNKVKAASVSDLNKYIDILMPQVMTGFTKGEIISLGTKAIMGGWAGFERESLQVPSDDDCQSGSADMWIWVVDYHKAAHDLQMALYGQSNIPLEEGRTTLIDVYNGANYSGSDSNQVNDNSSDDDSSYDEDYNNDYNDEPETQDSSNNSDDNQSNEETENNNNNDTTVSTPEPTENSGDNGTPDNGSSNEGNSSDTGEGDSGSEGDAGSDNGSSGDSGSQDTGTDNGGGEFQEPVIEE